MRTIYFLSFGLVVPFCVSGAEPLSKFVSYVFPSFGSKSAESTKIILADLGIGDRAYDASKIVNLTDSNWQHYIGPQGYGHWLVEFTADQKHCASCEYIDLAFNDASHKLAQSHPELRIGRVDCSEEIILSTRFIITKPPILYLISPATRVIRPIPPEVARPDDLVEYFNTQQWRQVAVWNGTFNPFGHGYIPVFVTYGGILLKAYTKAVDRIPQWLGLIIIGALSSFILSWMHGVNPARRTPETAEPNVRT